MVESPRVEEAAAIAAAIERFEADAGPSPATVPERHSRWQRAALIEGVGAQSTVQDLEGGAIWQS